MREIKFRAWDLKSQVMKKVDCIDFKVNACRLEDYTCVNLAGVILMQFTGLKDKNGTEIYEGDIVRCWGGEFCQGYWQHDTQIEIKNMINDCFMMGEHEFLEVIGNKYDTKE